MAYPHINVLRPSIRVVSCPASYGTQKKSLVKHVFNFGSQCKYMTWYDPRTLPLFMPNLIHVFIAELLASPKLQLHLAYPKLMGSFIDRWLNARQTGPLSALSS